GTMLLVTATRSKDVKEGQDFFPLTVDYIEKFYASGKFPGGFIKRIYMSHVDFSDNKADAYFPKIDLDKWITLTEENHDGWKFCIYEKFNG
ncbi:MAG: hypothetical protein ACFNUP_01585, partial [Leptotrichia hofstadii]